MTPGKLWDDSRAKKAVAIQGWILSLEHLRSLLQLGDPFEPRVGLILVVLRPWHGQIQEWHYFYRESVDQLTVRMMRALLPSKSHLRACFDCLCMSDGNLLPFNPV